MVTQSKQLTIQVCFLGKKLNMSCIFGSRVRELTRRDVEYRIRACRANDMIQGRA